MLENLMRGNINQSLITLGMVISCLVERDNLKMTSGEKKEQ